MHRVPTSQRVIALTFDDGPHPIYTPALLQVLALHKVHATFFMIGEEMARYPDIVRQVAAAGHVIGNHTQTHPRDLRALSPRAIDQELAACDREITRLQGHPTRLFRAPRGRVDAVVVRAAEQRGYATIGWSICGNRRTAATPQAMAQRVIKHSRPGSIILLHDGTDASRWKDVMATAIIIKTLQHKGYRFVTVPELLALKRTQR